MKKTLAACSLLFILSLTIGCKKDDNSNNPQDKVTVKGENYFPLSAGMTIKAKVTGTMSAYDSTGKLVYSEGFNDQVFSALIGNQTQFEQKNVFPLLGYDNKKQEYVLAGYFFNNGGEIIGLNQLLSDPDAVLLPKEISVGQEWKISNLRLNSPALHIKLIEILDNYTDSQSRKYTDVINLSISSSDSSSTYSQGSYRLSQENLTANLYLAKGKGIIELKLNDTAVSKYSYNYSGVNQTSYTKIVSTGVGTVVD
ncbi:MAG: hypothetical protein ACM34K_12605 [Bacillota bacterium]